MRSKERWELGEKEKKKKEREKSYDIGSVCGSHFFSFFGWKHNWVMGAKRVGFMEFGYFKWWAMSDK